MIEIDIYCNDEVIETERDGLMLLLAARDLVYFDHTARHFRVYLGRSVLHVTDFLQECGFRATLRKR
jgi:transposase-like protein